jgi:hypothetical protein
MSHDEIHRYYRNKNFSVLKTFTRCCQSDFLMHQYTYQGKKTFLVQCVKCGTEWTLESLITESIEGLSKSPNKLK